MNDLDSLLDKYLTKEALSGEFQISTRTLDRWHELRIGPPRVVIGRMILYRKEAVREWLEANEEGRKRSRR